MALTTPLKDSTSKYFRVSDGTQRCLYFGIYEWGEPVFI